MDYREKVLNIAKNSPVLPMQVAKALNTDSLMAGAMLSEMTGKGTLKVSNLKIGGSPLYYIPGNEFQLVNYLENINQKERETALLLKDKKILRDTLLTPLVRICLKNIKDFAKPLEATFNNQTEIFWKWFLISDTEAEKIIREIIAPEEESKKNILETTQIPQNLQTLNTYQEQQTNKEKITEEQPKQQKTKTEPFETIKTKKEEKQKYLTETKTDIIKEKETNKETNKETEIKMEIDKEKTKSEPKQKQKKPKKTTQNFWTKIEQFFKETNINIIEKKEYKRTDFELIITFQTPFGNTKHFCKAIQKNKINETDITTAFAKAKLKKLPLIIISNGTPETNAEKFLELGVQFKRI